MGFDLSGVNPKMNMEMKEFPVYNKYNNMDWSDKMKALDNDEKLSKQYWKEYDEYQDANPGVYFRNNVWWWRPLWQFVCERFDDVLTEQDMERGCYNDGHEITADKAMQIGIDLTCMLEDGRIEAYADRYEKELKELRGTMGELIQVINSLKENSNKEILMMRVAYKNGIQVSGRYN